MDALGVSADELLGLKPIKPARHLGSDRVVRRLRQIEKLPNKDRKQLLGLIDTFLDRERLSRKAG